MKQHGSGRATRGGYSLEVTWNAAPNRWQCKLNERDKVKFDLLKLCLRLLIIVIIYDELLMGGGEGGTKLMTSHSELHIGT